MVTGNHDDVLQVSLQAEDILGQASAWRASLPFVVDAQPPIVSIDTAAMGIASSGVTRGALRLYGDVTDSRGISRVEVCSADTTCANAELQPVTRPSGTTVDDAPGPIAITEACIVRTFTVVEDFVVGQVALGFTAEHPRRGELRVDLTSPSGTTVHVLGDGAGTDFASYDVLLADANATGIETSLGDHNPQPPYFDRAVRPASPLQSFEGQNSAGQWTLTICDSKPDANAGSYLRGQLGLSARDTLPLDGRWTYQTPLSSDLDYVNQVWQIYAQDAVGNRTAAPLTFEAWVDNVAPILTVTDHLPSLALGQAATIIRGAVTDGSPTTHVVLQIQAPDGTRSVHAAAREGEQWWYDLTARMSGAYTISVAATDAAGNLAIAGPYGVEVSCIAAHLTAGLVSTEPSANSPFTVTLTAAITNTSKIEIPAGLPVTFSSGIQPIGSTLTTQPLAAGQTLTVTLDWPVDHPGDYDLTVMPNAVTGSDVGERLALCAQPAAATRTISVLDRPLYDLWNLVSFAVDPLRQEIATVTRPLGDNYISILSYDQGALSYYPALPSEFSSLKTMDARHGYTIRTTLPATVPASEEVDPVATLRVSGIRLAENQPLLLAKGWNLVSYLPRASLPVTEALHSIDGHYQAVLTFNRGAQSFYPILPPNYNTLQVMQPGMGYWIRTTGAVTLTYPVASALPVAVAGGEGCTGQSWGATREALIRQDERVRPIREAEQVAGVRPSAIWVDFIGVALAEDGTALPAGTIIHAVDPQGMICGATVIVAAGEYGPLACYGDLDDTEADEGAQAGDEITLFAGQQQIAQGIWTANTDVIQTPEEPVTPEPPGEEPGPYTSRIYLPIIYRDAADK